jgi:hypothetical protein
MRLLLQGIKNGLFTARFQWAESCGSDRASRFISKTSSRQFRQQWDR